MNVLHGTTTLTLALASLFAPSSPQSAAPGPEEEAAELLAKGEEHVARGRHRRGLSLYTQIVRRFPETAAAEVAERRTWPNAFIGWSDVVRTGPSSNRVDFVVMGDGFPIDDQGSFDKIAADVPRIFERNPTYAEYLSYLNVLRANVVSEEKGVDAFGREYSTALGGYMTEGEQGQVGVDHAAVRAMLAEMSEHDGQALALVRQGTLGTGGNGIAAVAARGFPTMIHEIGHSFVGLQDEYATFTGHRGPTSSRVNVSDTDDPEEVPWTHFIEAKVRGVGVYEGADGRVRGAWKPTSKGCIMGEGEFFCPVCREAVVLRIHDFVDPIEEVDPDPLAGEVHAEEGGEPIELTARVMTPASHALEVSWWVLPEDEAPLLAEYDPDAARLGRRGRRGPLAPIDAAPAQRRRDRRGLHRFTVRPGELGPGRHVVVCRAVDHTEIRGERWPWVLRDERHVLRSERSWVVVVE